MSKRYVCDHAGCEQEATFRLIARPVASDSTFDESGVDTCDLHYEFTHPGRAGGAWWDEFSAPQTGGREPRP